VAYVSQTRKHYTHGVGVCVSSADLDVLCQTRTHVRFGSLADICGAKQHVRFTANSDPESGHPETGSLQSSSANFLNAKRFRFTPESGQVRRNLGCPLWAISGHWQCSEQFDRIPTHSRLASCFSKRKVEFGVREGRGSVFVTSRHINSRQCVFRPSTLGSRGRTFSTSPAKALSVGVGG